MAAGRHTGQKCGERNEELRLHAEQSWEIRDTLSAYWSMERRYDEDEYRTAVSVGLSYYF